MPLTKRETLEKRAVKRGVKASRKQHRVISEEELLDLRVQTLPAWLRLSMVLAGLGLILAGWQAWPSDSTAVQALEIVSGIFAILFGAFGVRRTLGRVFDSMEAGDAAGAIVELVTDAVSGIDL